MSTPDPETVTRLLQAARAGASDANEQLFPLLYGELHELAAAIFNSERRGHTLQPTAVIHEAWLKLAGRLDQVEDRRHFFILASRAMRQVLTDHARGARAEKRGAGQKRVTLDDGLGPLRTDGVDLVELDDLLERLAGMNARHARVVELRVFGGLTIMETAEALEVSHSTIEADWFTARAWLRARLASGG